MNKFKCESIRLCRFLLLMPRIPVTLVMRGSNGYSNNTEEQWNEFSNNYKNGNYKVA